MREQYDFYPFFIFVVHFNLNYCNGIVSIQMGGAKYTVTSPRTITVCLTESCFNTYLEFRYILIFRQPMFSPNYLHFMT